MRTHVQSMFIIVFIIIPMLFTWYKYEAWDMLLLALGAGAVAVVHSVLIFKEESEKKKKSRVKS